MKNTKIVIFQDYDSGIIVNDVSLIKVDAPFEFNDNVKAIALPEQGYDPEGKRQVFFCTLWLYKFFFCQRITLKWRHRRKISFVGFVGPLFIKALQLGIKNNLWLQANIYERSLSQVLNFNFYI